MTSSSGNESRSRSSAQPPTTPSHGRLVSTTARPHARGSGCPSRSISSISASPPFSSQRIQLPPRHSPPDPFQQHQEHLADVAPLERRGVQGGVEKKPVPQGDENGGQGIRGEID